ncbi:37S ribosomal protein [Niveomyces insectorum RCEF 264]|uniref:37S ribosomal protein n=1 Tax=Niveomyces insectorum RCEF 264 TaxID=1081102 RepID=A0A167LQV0_9HYPO|nr:37S ribosomal protein [Niveomyces insectorum RCEF 264]
MASVFSSLRLCLRKGYAAAPTTAASFSFNAASAASKPRATVAAVAGRAQCFSSIPIRWSAAVAGGSSSKEQPLEDWEREMLVKEAASERITDISGAMRLMLPPTEREKLNAAATPQDLDREMRMLMDVRQAFSTTRRGKRKKRLDFYNDFEADPEMITREQDEDEFKGDDITSMAHGKLDEHRERRHYARIAAWEMPLLTKFAKPFEPPTSNMPLRFRYTSYMGEFHPAEKKVVVEFCPADLGLTEVQQSKLKKLVGPRFNPETGVVRMSCEMHEHQAQNKRHLGDLIGKLIVEAKDPTDTFQDIPLDTRHHVFKHKPKFPREWRMTEERKKELQSIRARSFNVDQNMIAESSLIDGSQRIQAAVHVSTQRASAGKVAELIPRRSNSGGQSPIRR